MKDEDLRLKLSNANPLLTGGHIVGLTGSTVRAAAPAVRAGELVVIERPAPHGSLEAEVVGFDGTTAILMPLGDPIGIGLDDPVRPLRARMQIQCGEGLLGRVLDGLGRVADGRGAIEGATTEWDVDRSAPIAMERPRITRALPLGVRAVDAFATVGEGQRIGFFAGAGAGKSTLLGQIARQSGADVVVVALVGERGREVREFVEGALGDEGLKRAVVIAATSDEPARVRVRSAFVATSVAEYFRDRGARVLLLFDSITRVARAQREVGLAAGEPPSRRGFPPSVFTMLPKLIERTGCSPRGSITAVYTVLVEGNDLDEPVADDVRALLDGHVVLDRAIGARGRWPAVDVVRSLSRCMDSVATPEHREWAARVRALLAAYESKHELIALGAYARGSDPLVDEALSRFPRIDALLRQRSDERSDLELAVRRLGAIVS